MYHLFADRNKGIYALNGQPLPTLFPSSLEDLTPPRRTHPLEEAMGPLPLDLMRAECSVCSHFEEKL